MTYETVATYSQLSTLFLFIGLFLGFLVWAYWPGQERKFDEVQRQSLDLDAERKSIGGR